MSDEEFDRYYQARWDGLINYHLPNYIELLEQMKIVDIAIENIAEDIKTGLQMSGGAVPIFSNPLAESYGMLNDELIEHNRRVAPCYYWNIIQNHLGEDRTAEFGGLDLISQGYDPDLVRKGHEADLNKA